MKKLLWSLASLKLAVVLLVMLLVGLAIGTIVESSRGAEVAGRLVYYSWWFLALQTVFAINVLASIVTLFPWGNQRIGFLTTHGALIVILVGASMSYFLKEEGRLMLWEGETGNEVANYDGAGHLLGRTALPFSVKLDDFRVSYYPGTMRPANFRSDVQIVDPAGSSFAAGIWMNHEFSYRGWRLFQSSYHQERGREATILSASKDPGQAVVFAGYVLLVVGMCIVLGTRIAQTRAQGARLAQLRALQAARGTALGVALILAGLALPDRALAGTDPSLAALARLPVQHDGRVMPLDTMAREAVWNVTGTYSWHGANPVAMATSWSFAPEAAAQAPVVRIGNAELAAAAGLPPGTTHASFQQLVGSRAVLGLIEQARQMAEARKPRTGAVAAAEKLEDRLLWVQRFMDRSAILPIPAADPSARWSAAPVVTADALVALANGPRLDGWPSASAVERELTYNAVRPMRVAWVVLMVALGVSLASWNRPSKALAAVSFAGLAAGFAVVSWAIATRWAVAGRIPASNMFESLLFLAWGVGLFAVIAFAALRNRLVVLNANAMAALTLMLTDLLPIDGFIHPVAPVLAGTVWLAIHVPIIMVSYAVLALGVVIAHMQVGYTIFAPGRGELIGRMNELLYWYVMIGSILLVTGILTGSMWAASSWGRYWGWDPKEVWSLVAFLAYVAILHARWNGWLGPFGVASMSIVAFQTILMTYLGVNFVLTTGMHSYGFGDSPVVTWMLLVATIEAAFLAVGLISHRRAAPAA
jgi:ABC-type transport system involved in cytochrome c biogenesis permease subunit